MLDQEQSSTLVTVQPSRTYYPWEWESGHWVILCEYVAGTVEGDGEIFDLRHVELHYGRFSGRLVSFTRLSDAERLCCVLNAE